jgi:LmbE family N-acetylglucosaminyl deacetylase
MTEKRENLGVGVPWLVISPHFDDAALSCGHLLALNPGSVVLTICSGVPEPGVAASSWDRLSGFMTAEQAARERRAEDEKALGVLATRQVTTDILDGPYRDPQTDIEDKAVEWIRRVMDEVSPERVAVPVGTRTHGDDMMTRRAGVRVVGGQRSIDAYLYADLPYFSDGHGSDVIASTAAAELVDLILVTDEIVERKAAALSYYRSQLPLLAKGFGSRFGAVFLPGAERLYRLHTGPE